jgi:hypothetical protein
VKRPVHFLLLISFLLGSTEFGQFLKIRSLLSHYSEHLSFSQDLSFCNFLYMHYVGDDQDPRDDERERQLPFKGHANPFLAGFLPPTADNIGQMQDAGVSQKLLSRNDNKPLSAFQAVILQPPKNV